MTPPEESPKENAAMQESAKQRDLFAAIFDDAATDEQIRQFEERLRGNAQAVDDYARYAQMRILVQQRFQSSVADAAPLPPKMESAAGIFGQTIHSWRLAAEYFDDHPMTLAYLVATVFFLVVGIVASHIYVTTNTPASVALQNNRSGNANNSAEPSSTLPSPPKNAAKIVGRITGEADCRWKMGSGDWRVGNDLASGGRQPPVRESGNVQTEHQQGAHATRSPVSLALGDKIVVASGLLEITYDSGSKVILQGPCRFNVETNGGFLVVGRLTGRMEKRDAGKTVGSAKPQAVSSKSLNPQIPKSPSLPTTHYPLSTNFVIATPTALVTDLGTEFGVEVNRNGVSEVHVLQGLVQAKFLDTHGRVFQSVQLKQGEARLYDRKAKRVAAIPANQTRFSQMQAGLREDHRFDRWLAFSREMRNDPTLVAYYTFESSGATSSVLQNVSPSGSEMNGTIVGARWANGRLPGKASLWFHSDGDYVALPHPSRFDLKKAFSLVVWFQPNGDAGPKHALIAKGDVGWRILQRGDVLGLTFDTNCGLDGRGGTFYPVFGNIAVQDAFWHQAVAVFDGRGDVGHKYFYIDGQLDKRGDVPLPLAENKAAVWIGNNSQHPTQAFCGWIDEAAIFSRALSALEVLRMYDAGDPSSWAATLTLEPKTRRK